MKGRRTELHHKLEPREGDAAALARRFEVEVVPGNPATVLEAFAELLVAMWLRSQQPEEDGP